MSMRKMADLALNQTAVWKERLGLSPYGGVKYAPDRVIACRISYKHRIVLSDQGEEITSGALVTTLAPVNVGDAISLDGRDYPVLEVQRKIDLDGTENRRKVYI